MALYFLSCRLLRITLIMYPGSRTSAHILESKNSQSREMPPKNVLYCPFKGCIMYKLQKVSYL